MIHKKGIWREGSGDKGLSGIMELWNFVISEHKTLS